LGGFVVIPRCWCAAPLIVCATFWSVSVSKANSCSGDV